MMACVSEITINIQVYCDNEYKYVYQNTIPLTYSTGSDFNRVYWLNHIQVLNISTSQWIGAKSMFSSAGFLL